MANKVDPFVIKWPIQWLTDPEIEPVIRYLNRFLHDLWIRTGGGNDDIAVSLEDISKLQQKDAEIESGVSKNRAINTNQDKELSKLLHLTAELISDNSKLRAELNNTNRLAKNMNQLLAELQ